MGNCDEIELLSFLHDAFTSCSIIRAKNWVQRKELKWSDERGESSIAYKKKNCASNFNSMNRTVSFGEVSSRNFTNVGQCRIEHLIIGSTQKGGVKKGDDREAGKPSYCVETCLMFVCFPLTWKQMTVFEKAFVRSWLLSLTSSLTLVRIIIPTKLIYPVYILQPFLVGQVTHTELGGN